MEKETIKKDILDYLMSKNLVDNQDDICSNSNLFMEYGFDSISMVEMMLHLEELYNIEFDIMNFDFNELKTIDNICENTYRLIRGGL